MAEPQEAPSRLRDPVYDQWAENRSLTHDDSNTTAPATDAGPDALRWPRRKIRRLTWLWVAGVFVGFLIKSLSINWTLGLKESSFGATLSTDWTAWLWLTAAVIPPIALKFLNRRGH
jgi:hypothetical protein